jgi:hypothetical protein
MIPDIAAHQIRLRQPSIVQGLINLPLCAPKDVPIRLAMPYQDQSRHLLIRAPARAERLTYPLLCLSLIAS